MAALFLVLCSLPLLRLRKFAACPRGGHSPAKSLIGKDRLAVALLISTESRPRPLDRAV
jgi:hypothetical protein